MVDVGDPRYRVHLDVNCQGQGSVIHVGLVKHAFDGCEWVNGLPPNATLIITNATFYNPFAPIKCVLYQTNVNNTTLTISLHDISPPQHTQA